MPTSAYQHRENEHQELFYLGIDPAKPAPIHIPSPLGRLPYHIYVRIASGDVDAFHGVVSKVAVGGLRPESYELATEPLATGDTAIASKRDGLVWRRVCTADVSRGNGTIEFVGVDPGCGRVDLLLCTWPRYVASGEADDWIECQTDPLWAPSGVPLGGIGGGRVDICRDGRFRNFSMNNNQDAPLEGPLGLAGAYLAVGIGAETRELASRPVVAGHGIVPTLRFDARFPQAKLIAHNAFDGVDVETILSGATAPHDLRLSSIPGFLLKWHIRNKTDRQVQITCRLGWPNLVGIGGGISRAETKIGEGDGAYTYWSDPSGQSTSRVNQPTLPEIAAVRFTGKPSQEHLSSNGAHVIAVLGGAAQVDDDGNGTVERTLIIPASEEAYAIMSLVTAMPHWVDTLHIDRGAYWQNAFGTSAAAESTDLYGELQMTDTLLEAADAVFADTSALADHIADSTMPQWLQRRLSNCCYPLVTNSIFYKDGRFSINEGPTEMAGCYGTIDQRLAAHPATQLLFPRLNEMELTEFANIQAENGGIAHDLGRGGLEAPPGDTPWPDLTCSFIIQTARHAWSTDDRAFDDAMYPRAIKSLRRHAEWAIAGNGVAQLGDGLGTSYDSYHYFATTGYMATLWIAALNICEQWATRRQDPGIVPEIATWRDDAVKRLEADLWNGRYYDAYGNGADISRKTCHAGQIAGQRFSVMLTGKNVLPTERLDAVIDSLLTLNGSERYAVPPDEVAADGSVGSDFSWLPYIEGFMLTAIGTRGDERLWPIWERMVAATYSNGATPCDTRLMYIPETGAQTWGTYYMTAPASWLVYDAWTGFFHDAQTGVLRLRDLGVGRYPLVSPLFWATLEITANGHAEMTLQRTFTEKPIKIASIELHTHEGIEQIPIESRQPLEAGGVIEWVQR